MGRTWGCRMKTGGCARDITYDKSVETRHYETRLAGSVHSTTGLGRVYEVETWSKGTLMGRKDWGEPETTVRSDWDVLIYKK